MTDQNNNEQQAGSAKETTDGASGDSRFNFMVTGLMVIIVVALSALWLRERALRVKCQRQGVQLKRSLAEAHNRALLVGFGATPVSSDFVRKLEIMAANPQRGTQKPPAGDTTHSGG